MWESSEILGPIPFCIFTDDLGDGIESMFIKITDDNKL